MTLRADLFYTHVPSPIGVLLAAGDGEALHLVSFPTGDRTVAPASGWRRDAGALAAAARQLEAYFSGDLRRFDLPLAFTGTPFQQAVWRALIDIPYGQTVSYRAIAERIGRPAATRAVGAANGANPLPIVAPCHRVIGANGSLTGFGGGMETKAWLLAHESGRPRLL